MYDTDRDGGRIYEFPGDSRFAAIYDYRDEERRLLFQVCRTKDKGFRQRRLDEQGKWIWSTAGVRKVLYRLSELLAAIGQERIILVPEGEKDVDNLWRLGFAATCNPGGASSWKPEFSETFQGADIIILPDNDEPGRRHADMIAQMSLGLAKSIRVLDLAKHWPDIPKGADVSDWFALEHTGSELETLLEAAPEWTEQGDDGPPLPFIAVADWDGKPVPERDWAVLNRIPARNVALLSGEGAAGKDILALQLAAAHVLNRDWLGAMPKPGPVLYLNAEDERDEIWRRLDVIRVVHGVTFADLKDFHPISLAGDDAVLGAPSKRGLIEPTRRFEDMRERLLDIKPVMFIASTVADIFAGNENDRSQVRQFVGLMRSLCIEADCAMLMLSHPSLTGMASGSGMSGSTAWRNSVRARSVLTAEKKNDDGDDSEPDPDNRVLEWHKNSYGPLSERITLRWKSIDGTAGGLFLPAGGLGSLEQRAGDARANNRFLDLLARFTRQNQQVSHKPSSTYAPTLFAAHPDAKGISAKAFAAAMQRLLDEGAIRIVTDGPPSKRRSHLER